MTGTAAVVLVLAGVSLAGAAMPAGAASRQADEVVATAACPTSWNTKDKSLRNSPTTPLRNITTSEHRCYDRLVVDVPNVTDKIGYHVGYVKEFTQEHSGEPIKVKGGAILAIVVNAPSYDTSNGKATYPAKGKKSLPGVNVTGYKTFRDTKFGASVEGQTQFALGLRSKLPYRITQSGDKLIVDVVHTR
ncbi:hypothetical protein ACIQNQ_35420 [Streptomyces werraensis]|uniref:AMIN-like domain-containing (lipo)protein n=1 Tax=Streptomyces werraensis TaxID=68284 RepID=UPI003800EC10